MKKILGLVVIGQYPVLECAVCRKILEEGAKVWDSREIDDVKRDHIVKVHAGKENGIICGNVEITQATPQWLATAWAKSKT